MSLINILKVQLVLALIKKPYSRYVFFQDIPVGSFLTNIQKEIDFKAKTDPIVMKISERYFSHFDIGSAFKNASKGQIVMGESEVALNVALRKQFTNK